MALLCQPRKLTASPFKTNERLHHGTCEEASASQRSASQPTGAWHSLSLCETSQRYLFLSEGVVIRCTSARLPAILRKMLRDTASGTQLTACPLMILRIINALDLLTDLTEEEAWAESAQQEEALHKACMGSKLGNEASSLHKVSTPTSPVVTLGRLQFQERLGLKEHQYNLRTPWNRVLQP